MAEAGSLKINILADIQDFVKSMEKVHKDIEDLGKKVTAFGLVVAGGFLVAVKAAADNESAVSRLSLAMKNQGIYSDDLRDKYLAQAEALMQLTTYDDEEVIASQSILTNYGLQGKQLELVTKLTADFATTKKMDLEQASVLVGKAFVGETSSLSRYGIIIDENIPKAQKFGVAMQQMAQLSWGSGEAARQTFTGQLISLKIEMLEFAETIGKIAMPYARQFLDWCLNMASVLRGLNPETLKMATAVAAVGGAVALVVGPTLMVIGMLPSLIAQLKAGAMLIAGVMSPGILAVVGAVALAGGAIYLWVTRWEQLRDACRTILNYVIIDGINAVIGKINDLVGYFNSSVLPWINKIPGLAGVAALGVVKDLNYVQGHVEKGAKDIADHANKAGQSVVKGTKQSLSQAQNELKGFFGYASAAGAKDLKEKTDRMQKEEEAFASSRLKILGIDMQYNTNMMALQTMVGAQKTALLQANLTTEEQATLLAHVKNLEEQGKFDQAHVALTEAVTNAQIAEEKRLTTSKKELQVQQQQNFVSTMNFISTLSDSKNRELVLIGKAAAIASATISTLEAATKALSATPWPPANMALASAVYAAGMANVAKIVGVKMAMGGVVMPTAGGTQATIGEAGKPEAVIPLNDMRAKKTLRDTLGGNQVVVNVSVSGKFLESDPAKWQRLVREHIVPEIRRYTDISPKGNFNRKRGQS